MKFKDELVLFAISLSGVILLAGLILLFFGWIIGWNCFLSGWILCNGGFIGILLLRDKNRIIQEKRDVARDYELLLCAGNTAQMEKLMQNEHKRGFDDIDLYYAFNRISDEVMELKQEIAVNGDYKDYGKVRHEAADVANFAHMMILQCDREIKKQSKKANKR